MKKSIKRTLFAVAAISAVATAANAGTLKTAASNPAKLTAITIAKEKVEGNTVAAPLASDITAKLKGTIALGAFTGGVVVTPTDIPLVTLTDGVMSFGLGAGKITVVAAGGDELQVCDAAGKAALIYKNGSGTSTIVFDKGTGTTAGGAATQGTISNTTEYTLMWGSGTGDCTAAVGASSISITTPPGTTSNTLTVKTGIATTQVVHDTAVGTLVSVADQMSASVTSKAALLIDYENTFKKLYNTTGPASNLTADTIDISLVMGTKDFDATTGAGDVLKTTFVLSDVSGIKTTGTAGIAYAGASSATFAGAACTDIDVATKKVVCTSTAGAAILDTPETEVVTYTINVDGTSVINEKSFTATAEFDFANATTKDRTIANSTALFTNSDAGSWKYRGTTIYVPLIKEAAGTNTFIKLQSKESATVRGLVLCSNGTTAGVELGNITAGTPKAITSTDIVTALGGACTVNAASGYAATLSVTSDKSNVFGYANTTDAVGNSRRIPLSIESGVSN